MAGKQRKQRQPSALSQALMIYRDKHKFTQEELAVLLSVEPRTLRRWENGETILSDTHELKHIADKLGIPYEHLGIAPSLYVPLTVEQMNTTIDRIWYFIDDGRVNEAHAIAENLVREAQNQFATEDTSYLRAFTRMYHAVAHATSLSVRTDNVGQAIYYYQQMEYFARLLKDDTQINIALAYLGDMYRRKGDIQKAIAILEEARDTTPLADLPAQGNVMQLLARSYIRLDRVQDFDRAIKTSEDIALELLGTKGSTGNQYHLAHVYEEYAKGYDLLKKSEKAMDFVDKAEKAHTITKSVEILLKLVRAEILIHSGDIATGEPLAVEAAAYTREHGHQRRLERIYALKRFLNGQSLKYGKAEASLSEALEGAIEQ
jgi:transcriptional regulator with XRE-family HTH domain